MKSRQFSLFARRRMLLPKKAILEAMTPIAEKFIAEAKAQGEDSPRMAFLILTKTGLLPFLEFFLNFSSSEKFETSPQVSAHPSLALIKWLQAESSRTGGVVALQLIRAECSSTGSAESFRTGGVIPHSSPHDVRSSTHAVEELPQGPQGTTA